MEKVKYITHMFQNLNISCQSQKNFSLDMHNKAFNWHLALEKQEYHQQSLYVDPINR